jgi:hypothetical protein
VRVGLLTGTRSKSLNKKQGPGIFFTPKLDFFVTCNSMKNFKTLGKPLLGENYVAEKEEE